MSQKPNALENVLLLAGRMLLCAIFINSGLGKIFDFAGTTEYMAAKGMPMTGLFLAGAIVFEIVGGLSIVLGVKPRIGALLLMAFLIPATLIFHDFWAVEPDQQRMQMIQFMKNLGLFGGLLMVAGGNIGAWTVDALMGKKKPASGA